MKLQITACDRCGAKDTDIKIHPWTARKSSQRYSGDLCDTCWIELLNMFRPSPLSKGRHQIVVHTMEDIPKNA